MAEILAAVGLASIAGVVTAATATTIQIQYGWGRSDPIGAALLVLAMALLAGLLVFVGTLWLW